MCILYIDIAQLHYTTYIYLYGKWEYTSSYYTHSMYICPYIILARYREFVYCHIFLLYMVELYMLFTISVYIWNTGCMLFQISKKKHPIKYDEQPYTECKHLQCFYYGAIAPWRSEILRQIFFNWKMSKSRHYIGINDDFGIKLVVKNPLKFHQHIGPCLAKIAFEMAD